MARSNQKKALENESALPRPSLAVQNTTTDKKSPKKAKPKAVTAPAEPSQPLFNKMLASGNPTASRWMWIGIIVFAAAIFGIWGWSLKEQIGSIKWSESPESRLINKTRQDWNKLFEEEKVTQEKNNLKNAILGVINNFATSTLTATGTTTTSTSDADVATTSTTSTP